MKDSVRILGVGMHPWGTWGKSFLQYAATAARAAINEAGILASDIDFLVSAGTVRCSYPGHVAAAILCRVLGINDAEAITTYGACASGAHALAVARDRILAGRCGVALVVGSDVAQATVQDIHGPFTADIPNRAWLGLRATRRMHECGMTIEDLHRVRIKNSSHGASNNNARFCRALSIGDIEQSPIVADPLRSLHISPFSDGAAAVVLCSNKVATCRGNAGVHIRALTLSVLADHELVMPYMYARTTTSNVTSGRASNVAKSLNQAGIAPEDLSAVELYDTSSVSELDWYEYIGLCKTGSAESLLRSGATSLGGRFPVNVSGGLTSFGEAVAAQGLAQICELTWQLQGRCGARQIPRARTGLAVCDGMYGHVASTVLSC